MMDKELNMDNVKKIKINNYVIGNGCPCFIIAEAGVNHNGNINMALKLIDEASKACVDAVKFQSFKAANLVTSYAQKAIYQITNTNNDETQFEMLKKLELSFEDHQIIKDYCAEKGIIFISSPFDEQSADLLLDLDVLLFKIPSGEITNFPFIEHVAKMGKPVILSTGMSLLGEVEEAVNAIKAFNKNLILLHCTSNYPAKPSEANLLAMKTMRYAFNLPVGYSDHTPGNEVALAAVSLGACVIEKHFTLDKSLPGPDHKASLEPHELKNLIRGIRIVESAIGNGIKRPFESEKNTASVARKSLVANCDIIKGEILVEKMIARKRPGTGLKPDMLKYIINKKAKRNITNGTLLDVGMFEE